MNIHGSLIENLRGAVESMRRHRNKPVHPDTIRFWSDLHERGKTELNSNRLGQPKLVERLTVEMEAELEQRRSRAET